MTTPTLPTDPNAPVPTLVDHIANILFLMQQSVLTSGGDPKRVLGPLAEPWLAARAALRIDGKTLNGWATKEQTLEAVQRSLLVVGGTVGSHGLEGAGDFDFDRSWDPVAGMCKVCGTPAAMGPGGTCEVCGC